MASSYLLCPKGILSPLPIPAPSKGGIRGAIARAAIDRVRCRGGGPTQSRCRAREGLPSATLALLGPPRWLPAVARPHPFTVPHRPLPLPLCAALVTVCGLLPVSVLVFLHRNRL
jgi:hypothetical protein